MAIAVQPFEGTYTLDSNHSSFQFAVSHLNLSTFRASFTDVDARLLADGGELVLEGRARVESLSIVDPDFRAHVVHGADFFDSDAHPSITFRSTDVGHELAAAAPRRRRCARLAGRDHRTPRAREDGRMRLLAINGSLRRHSYNAALLAAASAECPPDVEFVVWRGLAHVPAYDEDVDTMPPPSSVAALRAELARADAVLVSTPEYNASVPGALKNALDWASRPYPTNVLRGKPVSVIGASIGLFGALGAQTELRKVLSSIGASVVGEGLSVPLAHDAFDGEGRLREPELARALRRTVRELSSTPIERAA